LAGPCRGRRKNPSIVLFAPGWENPLFGPAFGFLAILKMAKNNPDLPLPAGKASAVKIPLRTY
jgi:hypothetical protein